jgi:hypothetical protein
VGVETKEFVYYMSLSTALSCPLHVLRYLGCLSGGDEEERITEYVTSSQSRFASVLRPYSTKYEHFSLIVVSFMLTAED